LNEPDATSRAQSMDNETDQRHEPVADLLKVEPIARWEWVVLAILLSGCLAYWVFNYRQFSIPGSDFYEFVRTGKELTSCQAPDTYKRLPLYPVLLGLLGRVMPGDEPYIEAGLVANIVFSLGILVLLFVLTRRLVGWPAFVTIALVASLWLFHKYALQPLLEPCMGFFILLAMLLFCLRSRWQYPAVFCAALTRPEAVALVPVFFVLNLVYEEGPLRSRFLKGALASALASSGFVAWIVAAEINAGEGTHPYLAEMQERGLAWGAPLAAVSAPFANWTERAKGIAFVGCAVLLAVVFITGLIVSMIRFRRESLALVGFTALYLTAHVAFGVDVRRYAYQTSWIVMLYFSLGGAAILCLPWRWLARHRAFRIRVVTAVLAGLLCLCLSGLVARELTDDPGVAGTAVYLGLYLLALAGLFVWCGGRFRGRPHLGLTFAILVTAGASPFIGSGILAHSNDTWETKYYKYSLVTAGRWLKENMKPGELAVVVIQSPVADAGNLDLEQLTAFEDFDLFSPENYSLEAFTSEARRQGVTYVIYTYRELPGEDDDDAPDTYYYRKFREYLLNLFAEGRELPGYKLLATIPMPERVGEPPVHVYRLLYPASGPAMRKAPKS